MPENRRFSLRVFTKSLEDLTRRFLGGRAGEVRSQSREIDTEAFGGFFRSTHTGML
jgi:hypothetical protein